MGVNANAASNSQDEAEKGRREFDGEVVLGKGKTLLYEVHYGKLSSFRYDSILDLLRSTYFPSKRTYFLTIARNFSKNDKIKISKLVKSIGTDKVKICFIDYETLISLHKFVADKQFAGEEENRKVMKRLLLSNIFESSEIIKENLFKTALISARNRYPFEIQEPATDYETMTSSIIRNKLETYEERLQQLEDLMRRAIDEIREMRKVLNHNRKEN